MSDYELITLFYVVVDSLQTSVLNYAAVLFAFLIAADLIADKLQAKLLISGER